MKRLLDNDEIFLNKSRRSDDFRAGIRSAVRAYWNGDFNIVDFISAMTTTIRRGYTRAWYDGAQNVGILPTELTAEELNLLEGEIINSSSYIYGFADDIERGSKANGGKLNPLLGRAEMWANRYDMIVSEAMQSASRNVKLKWVWNPNKEHCADCLRLNGRVYRASIWRKWNLSPRMHNLACGGWRCGCVFENTSDPVTPGHPPQIGR